MLALDYPIVEPVAPAPVWQLATRLVFRFCLAYFGLYIVTTQMLGSLFVLPVGDFPDLGESPPVRALVSWVATHVFRVTYSLVISGSGSGDKTFDWVHAFCVLVIAAVATAVWSVLDRQRGDYARLHTWFHVFGRFALGSTMVSYGAVKAVPLQMPAPGLTRLLEPFGHFSPMGVLWYSIGASRPYEMFAGCAELAGGILLFFPRTAILGALICLADTIQIFALNMTYDVPVKLFSFHLILLSLFLLAPEARRLANVLVLNRTAGPSTQPPLGRSHRAMRIAVAAQIVFGLYLIGMNLNSARQSWTQYGGGAPKSALYGIWNVEEMTIDGHTRSPLLTDYGRWHRVVFDRPTVMSLQRMDDTFAQYGAAIDAAAKTLSLTKLSDKSWTARFAFQQPTPERLILDGEMDRHRIHMQLQLFDRNKFLLVSRGFHWVQETPSTGSVCRRGRSAGQPMGGRDNLQRVCAHVERHLGEPLTVERLARVARLSPYHFIRVFRAEIGTTPHQYVRQRRLERAKHLLATTPMAITEVCDAVGFESLGSFSSLFRRTTGESPAAYRASRRRQAYIPGCFVQMYRVGR